MSQVKQDQVKSSASHQIFGEAPSNDKLQMKMMKDAFVQGDAGKQKSTPTANN